jgi:spore maturation protein CgeB
MPVVFKSSAINLCPIFRGNVSGIPLRILDVMGCASFVLAPFRPEMDEYFKNGVEIVTYHSAGEAIEKADYYIKHPGERKKVALAGYERVKNSFSYKKQIGEILRSLK